VRWTEEKKGFAKQTLSINPASDEFSIDADESAIFTAWTPMASLSVLAPESVLDAASLDHLLGYFTFARGFKSGGFNGGIQRGDPALLIPYQPEFLDSFEIGAKTIALDQRVTLNVSVFYGDYDDIQVSTVETLIPGDPNSIERVIRNAATATTQGAEIELKALPLEGMQVTGSVGLLHTDYGDFLSPSAITGEPVQRSGQTFNQVPDFQSYLAVQYSFPIDLALPSWLTGWLTPRLDWYYQSAVHYEGPELVQGIQRGYNLLHARLSYDFDGVRIQVALWARNLTDQAYFTSTIPLATSLGTTNRFYDAPRTFGVELSRRF
jgi:iron complex outermembrane receptor protein